MPEALARRDDNVRSVDRAISILQVLARHGSLGVSQIARAVGVHKSTAFRLLTTLETRGMVAQGQDRGEYRLGASVVQLASGVTAHLDLTLISRSTTQQLAETVGETVNVVIHDGEAVISIDQHSGPTVITVINWVGRRAPLHASAAGKVFLAFPDDAGRPQQPTELTAYTPQTITDSKSLQAQLDEVRERGWSLCCEEQEEGLVAVGAPIRNATRAVVAAVTVSGPTFRMTEQNLPRIAEHTVAAADQIAYRNGLPKPATSLHITER